MSNIQPALPPIAPAKPAASAGGNGKGEVSAAADFLTLVVDASGEEAPTAEGEGIAGPLVEEPKESVSETAEGLIAVGAVSTILPEIAPTPTIEAEAILAPTPVVAEAAPSTEGLEAALTQAGKVKAVQDVLLAAQAPLLAPEETLEAPLDAKLAPATDTKPSDEKLLKDQAQTLPGSSLSMTETPDTTAELIPAALAFRKALDSRANAERASEPTGDTTRGENTTRSEARPTSDANAVVRISAVNEPAPSHNEETRLSTLGDLMGQATTGDEKFDALLGAKNAETKQASFSSALTVVKGVVVNPQAVVAQVAVQLTAAGKAKAQAMTVKLEPVELGKIDIRLDFGADGKVQASIFADRPQTLDMLQKDARGLEKALQNAGLQTDSGSLSFNLRGQDRDQATNGDGRKFSAGDEADDVVFGAETLNIVAGSARSAPVGRVDLLL